MRHKQEISRHDVYYTYIINVMYCISRIAVARKHVVAHTHVGNDYRTAQWKQSVFTVLMRFSRDHDLATRTGLDD